MSCSLKPESRTWRQNHIPAQAVLQNFMLERLLERISLSRYRDRIVLKGGLLIASMVGISGRTTPASVSISAVAQFLSQFWLLKSTAHVVIYSYAIYRVLIYNEAI